MANVLIKNGEVVEGAIVKDKANNITIVDDYREHAVYKVEGGDAGNKITVKGIKGERGTTGDYYIEGGSGNDTVKIENRNSVTGINVLNGNNTISTEGPVEGDILSGTGKDKITIDGYVEGVIEVAGGDNTITLYDDIINRSQKQAAVKTGDGNDKITNYWFSKEDGGPSVVSGNVNAGSGNNTITINGTVKGDIIAGDGNDKVTIGVHGEVEDISVGAGNNTITVSGVVGSITTGDDNDKITVNWDNIQSRSVINTGKGKDTLTLKNARGIIFDEMEDGSLKMSKDSKYVYLANWRDCGLSYISCADGKKDLGYIQNNITVNKERTATVKKEKDTITLTTDSVGHVKIGKDKYDFDPNGTFTVVGGTGNDTINVNSGSDYIIKGGKGNDKITIDWKNARNVTVVAEGKDIITVKNANFSDFKVQTDEDGVLILNSQKGDLKIENWENIDYISFKDGKVSTDLIGGLLDYGIIGTSKADKVVIDGSKATFGKLGIKADSLYFISTEEGNDTITVSNTEDIDIDAGIGNDTVVVNNVFTSDIWLDDGNDKVTVNGGYDNYIECGAGNDTVTINWQKVESVEEKYLNRNFSESKETLCTPVIAMNESEYTSDMGADKVVIKGANSTDFDFRYVKYSLGEMVLPDGDWDWGATWDDTGDKTALIISDKKDAGKNVIVYNWDKNALSSIKFDDKTLKVVDNKVVINPSSASKGGVTINITEKDSGKNIYGTDNADKFAIDGVSYIDVFGNAGADTFTVTGECGIIELIGGDGNDTFTSSATCGTSDWGVSGAINFYGGNGDDKYVVDWKGTKEQPLLVCIEEDYSYDPMSGPNVGKTKGTDKLTITNKTKDSFDITRNEWCMYLTAKDGSGCIEIYNPDTNPIGNVEFGKTLYKYKDLLNSAKEIDFYMMSFADEGIADTGFAGDWQEEQPVVLAIGNAGIDDKK